jgi:hypothetical protein
VCSETSDAAVTNTASSATGLSKEATMSSPATRPTPELNRAPNPGGIRSLLDAAMMAAVAAAREVKTVSSSSSRRMKIGDFLLRRLKETGVRHLFGVPGDYNLELLQQLQDTGVLKWIGTCSELNASYAADG